MSKTKGSTKENATQFVRFRAGVYVLPQKCYLFVLDLVSSSKPNNSTNFAQEITKIIVSFLGQHK